MDGAQDRLPAIRQTAQKRHDGPSTLRIKPRRRLVEEQQKSRLRRNRHQLTRTTRSHEGFSPPHLGGELDADRRALSVLDSKGADDGITKSFQPTHLEARLDTKNEKKSTTLGRQQKKQGPGALGFFFRQRNGRRLAHLGREEQGLPDGRIRNMRIHLLTISPAERTLNEPI
jgi:hypothetical protein